MQKKINIGIVALFIIVFGQISLAANDSWYFQAHFKPVISPKYSSDINNTLDTIGAGGHSCLGFDYGFYWKMGAIYLGPSITLYSDKFSVTNSIAYNTVILGVLSVSVLYPFFGDPASGPFVRGDLGYSVINRPGNFVLTKIADDGYGWQANFGWSFALNDKVSLLPIISYGSISTARSDNYSFFSAGFGVML